jgi:hypothetical protein
MTSQHTRALGRWGHHHMASLPAQGQRPALIRWIDCLVSVWPRRCSSLVSLVSSAVSLTHRPPLPTPPQPTEASTHTNKPNQWGRRARSGGSRLWRWPRRPWRGRRSSRLFGRCVARGSVCCLLHPSVCPPCPPVPHCLPSTKPNQTKPNQTKHHHHSCRRRTGGTATAGTGASCWAAGARGSRGSRRGAYLVCACAVSINPINPPNT